MDAVTAAALRAAQGDEQALARFVRETQGAVWRLCAHLVEPSAADDVTQEVYLRALPALKGFRGEASARTWILSIARNTCADELRRRGRGKALVERLVGHSRGRDRVVPDPAGAIGTIALVGGLDADRREAFVLTQLLGLTYAETAAVCGCEIGTVRSRVWRARAELVAALEDSSGDEPGLSAGP